MTQQEPIKEQNDDNIKWYERMMNLFHEVSQDCSRITVDKYSSSFSSAIRLLHKDLRAPVCNVYGFVRFADEIVDTFHQYDKKILFAEFKQAVYDALERRISLNPILHSFQLTVHEYAIDQQLIASFLYSMELDLDKRVYNTTEYDNYIYGSAEVVGLMCLYIFCEGNMDMYDQLQPYAKSLGAAFQKVNFLRDLKADYENLSRIYFPGCDLRNFTSVDKASIEADIQKDFDHAFEGIHKLPAKARFGVYVAYKYYLSLFVKIKKRQPQWILENRIRIPDYRKIFIVAKAGIRRQLHLI